MLTAVILEAPSAAAFSCARTYAVNYVTPTWVVELKAGGWAMIRDTWYVDPWNGSVERIGPHVGRNATAAERVTLQNRDGDGLLSASDTFQIWDANSTLHSFSIRWGPNETALYEAASFTLADGFKTECITPPFWWVDPIAFLLTVALIIAVGVLIFLVVWRAVKK